MTDMAQRPEPAGGRERDRPAPAAVRIALGSYAAVLIAAGAAMLLVPAAAVRLEAGSAADFVAHLNMSRAGSVVGLGLVAAAALGVAWRGALIGIGMHALLMAAILGLMQQTPAAAALRWPLVALCLLWAACCAWWAERSSARAPRRASAGNRLWSLALASYVLWTGTTGILWLLSPGLIGGTIVTAAGPAGPYVALARGSADLSLAVVAWSCRHAFDRRDGRGIVTALFVANLILTTVGLIAQLGSISSAPRWAICALHLFWLALFAIQTARLRSAPAESAPALGAA